MHKFLVRFPDEWQLEAAPMRVSRARAFDRGDGVPFAGSAVQTPVLAQVVALTTSC